MRIGLSTSVVQGGKTGIAQYVLALTRAFASGTTRHEFVLFTLERDLPLFDFARQTMQLVPVPERYRPALRNIGWHQAVLPKLARDCRLDVLHVPSYRRLLWPKPCPLVATIHDLSPFRVRRKYSFSRMFYGRVVARQLARRQDEIIVISHTTARDVARYYGVDARRLTVIHNGIDHSRFHPGPPDLARQKVSELCGIKGPYILYVARLEHPGKNHTRLIAAFNRFKAVTGLDWQLVLAGSDWTGAEVIHQHAVQSPYARDITCTGFIADADLPACYQAARLFVYPSLYEGFGLPPVEAMACGCPVISSTGGALAEIVGSGGIQVPPTDTDGLAAQMIRVAEDPAWAANLRRAGLARARCFSWESAAAATFGVYARAAEYKANH